MPSYVLEANIYGADVSVTSVVEYGEHEVKINDGPWKRVRYAVVNLAGNFQAQIPLEDLSIRRADIHERLAQEMDSMLGKKDERGFYRDWSL